MVGELPPLWLPTCFIIIWMHFVISLPLSLSLSLSIALSMRLAESRGDKNDCLKFWLNVCMLSPDLVGLHEVQVAAS